MQGVFTPYKPPKSARRNFELATKRMLNAAKYLNADSFTRITGDSPLIDPDIINKAMKLYYDGDYDLVTNIFPRSYPIGQSVEIIRTKTYERAYKNMILKDDLEHVTKYFLRSDSSRGQPKTTKHIFEKVP